MSVAYTLKFAVLAELVSILTAKNIILFNKDWEKRRNSSNWLHVEEIYLLRYNAE